MPAYTRPMITGTHVIVYTTDADATRAFLRDVLDLAWVDSGDGWLIFTLPPAEVAAHPAEAPRHELFFLCDDVNSTVEELRAKGVEVISPITDQGWGLETSIAVPGAGTIGLYEPRHASPPRATSGA
jgi:catechol 2,3-dioxygenase-like lactoylglutathione lyase family enzyme